MNSRRPIRQTSLFASSNPDNLLCHWSFLFSIFLLPFQRTPKFQRLTALDTVVSTVNILKNWKNYQHIFVSSQCLTQTERKKIHVSAEKRPESISSPVWEQQASPGTIKHRKFQEVVMVGVEGRLRG